ncbi:MAG: winged helix DNA-binding domain-containing protein [Anaerolineales bacterium]|nr:winged helix DNA-binding domain-containing protein [Anaerolineales bacterium]
MKSLDIAQLRLSNQHLAGNPLKTASEVVAWLGAVQAQEYAWAKWALGQRTTGLTDAAIEQALAEGSLLRTHVMRPTWHFVTPEDIRWLLALTAPRVNATVASYYRKLELDEATFARSNAVLAKALEDSKQLTRPELAAILQHAGIATADLLRFGHIMLRAELDAVVCSGALRGKQHTYALLDERVPQAKTLEHDEALAELARRYFTSHGPATLADFGWWSGLTMRDARAGLEMAKSHLVQEVSDGQTYWLPSSRPPVNVTSPAVHLLPAFDEYTVAYKDRRAILDPAYPPQAKIDILNPAIAVDGKIVGTWKRTIKKDTVVLTLNPFTALTEVENQAIAVTTQQYAAFLELPVVLA